MSSQYQCWTRWDQKIMTLLGLAFRTLACTARSPKSGLASIDNAVGREKMHLVLRSPGVEGEGRRPRLPTQRRKKLDLVEIYLGKIMGEGIGHVEFRTRAGESSSLRARGNRATISCERSVWVFETFFLRISKCFGEDLQCACGFSYLYFSRWHGIPRGSGCVADFLTWEPSGICDASLLRWAASEGVSEYRGTEH